MEVQPYSELDQTLEEIRAHAQELLDRADGRGVIEAAVREGAPVFIDYRTRGIIPHPQALQRIAVYHVALSVAMKSNMRGKAYGQARA